MNSSHESSNLDFMRSMAVLFVFGDHVLIYFQQHHSPYVTRLGLLTYIGHWGVLMFFVHTSLVLMFSLERMQCRFPGKPLYLPFLAKRVFRLFPLSVLTVLVVTIFKLPVGQIVGGRFLPAHLDWGGIILNLLLLQNLKYTPSVIAPLWSLSYEMQMYLVLPPLFLLVRASRRVWPLLLLWVVAVLVGTHARGLARFGVPDFIIYLPCFLSGVVAYKLTAAWRPRVPALLWPFALALMTAIFLARPNHWSTWWYCCLLLGAAAPQFREMTGLVARRMCNTIARYSYGIYLLHFICIWLSFQAIRGVPEWTRWIVLLVTTSVFPYVCYHLVEEPMIRVGERVTEALRVKLGSRLRATEQEPDPLNVLRSQPADTP